jgi:predicted transcriptional regulator
MIPQLTPEQSNALHTNGDKLKVLDPTTNRIYMVVDASILECAQAILARREEEDLAAVKQGIEDMRGGRTVSEKELDEAVEKHLRTKFGE